MSDPYDDFDRHEDANWKWEQRLPRCSYCGERIMEDTCYDLENGDLICRTCLRDYLKDNPDIMLDLAVDRVEEYYEVSTTERMEEE